MKKLLFLLFIGVLAYGTFIIFNQKANVESDSNLNLSSWKIADDKIVARVSATEKLRPNETSPQDPDGPSSHWYYSDLVTLQKDVVITGFEATLDGADNSAIHHISVIVKNRLARLCTFHFAADGGGHELYSASRNTLDPVKLPSPYGIFLKAGDQIQVEFMVHAQAFPHGQHAADEEISPTLVVTMSTDDKRTTPVDFLRLRLDDSPCEKPVPHQAFVVPVSEELFTRTGELVKGSAYYTFSESGTIVASGANFWPRKGGQNVKMFLNDSLIKEYPAEEGAESWQWNIPLSYDEIPFKSGDIISLTSDYINPFDVPVKDASGMLGIFYTIEESQEETE